MDSVDEVDDVEEDVTLEVIRSASRAQVTRLFMKCTYCTVLFFETVCFKTETRVTCGCGQHLAKCINYVFVFSAVL